MAVGWWVDSVSNHKTAASAAQDVVHLQGCNACNALGGTFQLILATIRSDLLSSKGHVFVSVHSQAEEIFINLHFLMNRVCFCDQLHWLPCSTDTDSSHIACMPVQNIKITK